MKRFITQQPLELWVSLPSGQTVPYPVTTAVGMMDEVPQLHPLGLVKPEWRLSSLRRSNIWPVLMGTRAGVHAEVLLTL